MKLLIAFAVALVAHGAAAEQRDGSATAADFAAGQFAQSHDTGDGPRRGLARGTASADVTRSVFDHLALGEHGGTGRMMDSASNAELAAFARDKLSTNQHGDDDR